MRWSLNVISPSKKMMLAGPTIVTSSFRSWLMKQYCGTATGSLLVMRECSTS